LRSIYEYPITLLAIHKHIRAEDASLRVAYTVHIAGSDANLNEDIMRMSTVFDLVSV